MGPSSPGTLAALLLMFAAAVAGMLRFPRWYARVPLIAATFLTAATCGISAVNAYYDYYQTWSGTTTGQRPSRSWSRWPLLDQIVTAGQM